MTLPLIENDKRQPVTWLTYPRPPRPDPLIPVGRNTVGEWMWPVVVDGLRVGFSHIAPPAHRGFERELDVMDRLDARLRAGRLAQEAYLSFRAGMLADKAVDAPDVWSSAIPPGGYVCGDCGTPTESEPCPEHQQEARRS